MTKEQRQTLRDLAELSTPVVAWYSHQGGDSYGKEATVRGPFFRWFKCTEVQPQYRREVSNSYDDAKFAAAAMNNLVPLLDEIDRLEKEVLELQTSLDHWGLM